MNPFLHLERNASDHPSGIFIVSPERTISNEEARTLAKKIAYELRKLGVLPGNVVALELPELLGALFTEALFHEGATSTVLPAGRSAGDGVAIDWIFTSTGGGSLPPDGARMCVVDDRFIANVEQNPFGTTPREFPSEQTPIRIVYSSGTTGKPKPIGYPLAMADFQTGAGTGGSWSEGLAMTLFGVTTLVGFLNMYSSVKNGQPFVSAGGAEPASIVALAERMSVSSITASPAQIAGVVRGLETTGRSLPLMRTLAVMGTVLPSEMSERISRVMPNCRVLNIYGSTEAGMAAMRLYPSDDPFDAGTLSPFGQLEIVDEDDRPVLPGATGRIRYQNPIMVHEYLGDTESTRASFKDGWFYPGDLGFIRSGDGGLTLAGRASEILNAGGVKVDPLKLDLVASTFVGVIEACSFSYKTKDGLDAVGIALVAAKDLDTTALITELTSQFGTAAPSFVALVTEIPKTSAGKLRRQVLGERFAEK